MEEVELRAKFHFACDTRRALRILPLVRSHVKFVVGSEFGVEEGILI